MDKLFDIDTYKGCQVEHPDEQTLIVRNVRGTSWTFRFQKVIEHWSVELRVYVAPSPDAFAWHSLWYGAALTSEQKDLWHQLQAQALRQQFEARDKVVEEALAVLRNRRIPIATDQPEDGTP